MAVEDKIGVVSEGVSEGEGGRGGEAIWLELDLSDPRKAKKAAEEFLKKEKRLDILGKSFAFFFFFLSFFFSGSGVGWGWLGVRVG